MKVLPQISRSYLDAWLLWDRMHDLAKIENAEYPHLPANWHQKMLRQEETDLRRKIVIQMLKNHVLYGPQPIMLLSKEEALAYQGRTDPQDRPGERASG